MAEKSYPCWGNCGRRLVFRRRNPYDAEIFERTKGQKRVRHSCPRDGRPSIFSQAMVDFSESFTCQVTGQKIFSIPTSRGVVLFNELAPWKMHHCYEHAGDVLPGIWNFPETEMLHRAQKIGDGNEPAVICCLKDLNPSKRSGSGLYLVALKTLGGRKMCRMFTGGGELRLGDLACVIGAGHETRLLTVGCDKPFEPEETDIPENLLHAHLHLSRDWEQQAA
jgi:hypothetical protein